MRIDENPIRKYTNAILNITKPEAVRCVFFLASRT